jgi:anti-anti-sigma factor
VQVAGEVDTSAAAELSDCLDELNGYVVVDLAGVTFLDSAGIAALVLGRRRLTRSGGELRLQGATPSVRLTLSVAGLDLLFVD